MGPPAPADPDLLHHFEPRHRSSADPVALHLVLQGAAAGLDLWATARCLERRACRELNPLGGGGVPWEAKAGASLVVAGITVWAIRSGRTGLARALTALAVVVQGYLGVRALSYGR
jgi:hypothetical protein